MQAPDPIPLRVALLYWLKLGFISFGGPAGQIALMHAELVERRRWISEQRFLHALNYCMLLPGPEATQLAVYIGWLLHRTLGGIMAGLLFILPSLLLLIGLSWIYLAWGHLPAVSGIMAGIKPAVVAIVIAAAWRIGTRTLRNGVLCAIAALAFVAIAVFDIPFPLIVLLAAMAGLIGGRIWPHRFQPGGGHPLERKHYGPALIDDDTPTPEHARFSLRHLLKVALIGCGLALAAWLALAAVYGVDGTLARMGWFFTKAALMTFGGAYAVLPYVVQGAVEKYGWLSAAQMIDGLALGETTPGPLIMIVAFVGFVGGWTHALFGPDSLPLAGAAGALVAALFTFLPSFVFILAGGPLVESGRGNVRFTAPLTAISAAVVGVVASLAVFFGQHVFFAGGTAQPAAIVIGAAASIALLGFKVGPIRLIAACALAGLVLSYWHV
ncbi:chromate efflux transporter [Telluria aromaticivorans]|uniref:Chromate efflux transporter n=1 Tax=Telluria aromaticivorans TaxID=2725995 RepID=A0A7Y2JXD1_9BURK|nr:chromate efflux transporter [Telluria aromaticivorans]NNG22685.1 chromate efflux transporter [Telluria aromaticivorans]